MFTDIVGYTALSQQNEKAALEMLQAHNNLIRPILERFRGREVKTIGDSFLVEFDSALEATECAAEIQKELAAHNKDDASPGRIHIRIGVHVGDVVHQGGDVFGDAVNIASRVQPLADPDGICISEQVYAQVSNKLPFRFAQMPAQAPKNVKFAVNVYKVIPVTGQELAQSAALPPRTRVAVLPFTNISHDQQDEYFADGVTEELITAISQVHELKVIARTSTARYKGTPKSVAEIGRELGVGSVLEGSTRMAGNKVRVTAQLIDTSTEEHIWANNYDRQLDDIFSIQSEIAKSVSEALRVQLLSGEVRRLVKRPTTSSSAFVSYLKGRAALHNRREQDLLDAKGFFEDAVASDASFAVAYVGLADTYFLLGEYYSMPFAEAMSKSKDALSKALSIDGNLPEAHVALANWLQHQYRFAEAVKEYEEALSLNPNYAQGHHWFAICLWDMNNKARAYEEILKAEELDPLSAVITFNIAVAAAQNDEWGRNRDAIAKLRQLDPNGEYADLATSFVAETKSDLPTAAACLESVIAKDPKDQASLARLGKVYALLGEASKAREILTRLEQTSDETNKPWNLAFIKGALGERDEMFRLLETAFGNHTLIYRALYFETQLNIKEDERYHALLLKAGLS